MSPLTSNELRTSSCIWYCWSHESRGSWRFGRLRLWYSKYNRRMLMTTRANARMMSKRVLIERENGFRSSLARRRNEVGPPSSLGDRMIILHPLGSTGAEFPGMDSPDPVSSTFLKSVLPSWIIGSQRLSNLSHFFSSLSTSTVQSTISPFLTGGLKLYLFLDVYRYSTPLSPGISPTHLYRSGSLRSAACWHAWTTFWRREPCSCVVD